MAYFPEYFVQQVLQATDIVDLIGRYLSLQQKGREFIGVCPFHDDHKPSMYVSPAKQIYKCFSCGAGGNAFQFVMNYDKLTFPETVRKLADQANIPLPKDLAPAPMQGGMSKNDLAGAVEFAAKIYQEQLFSPAGAQALEYARNRGLTDESIRRYGLGFAPDRWDTIDAAGRRAGVREEQLVNAGLVKRRDRGDGCYDYFRNRLIFPIHDQTGRIIAFGGRALDPNERAKYLNSPETSLFDKSSIVYGIEYSRQTIVQKRQVVVVEGYLDVLIPHQAGVTNVVATLGTALTERHVRLLSRYASEVVLLFDADQAGAKAAERALQLFLTQKLHVRVASIPAGKDPCDYVLAEGGEAFQQLIDQAPDAMTYIWQKRHEAYLAAGGNPTERSRVIDDFLSMVVTSNIYGSIEETRRAALAQHIAHIVNIPARDLQLRMKQLGRQVRPVAKPQQPVGSIHQQTNRMISGNPERLIMETLLDQPDLYDHIAERIDPADFQDAALRTLAEYAWNLGVDGKLSLDEMLAMEELQHFAPLITELAWASQTRGNQEQTLHEAMLKILDRKQRQELAYMKPDKSEEDEMLRQFHLKMYSISHQEQSQTEKFAEKYKPDTLRRPKIQ